MLLNRTIHPSGFLFGNTGDPFHCFQQQRKTCLVAMHIGRLAGVKITYFRYVGHYLLLEAC